MEEKEEPQGTVPFEGPGKLLKIVTITQNQWGEVFCRRNKGKIYSSKTKRKALVTHEDLTKDEAQSEKQLEIVKTLLKA